VESSWEIRSSGRVDAPTKSIQMSKTHTYEVDDVVTLPAGNGRRVETRIFAVITNIPGGYQVRPKVDGLGSWNEDEMELVQRSETDFKDPT
jgi:hypothetical protein